MAKTKNPSDSSKADAKLNKALCNLYTFLVKNHSHNHALQRIGLKSSLLPFETKKEKVRSLLVDAAKYSQKLDNLADFWTKVAAANKEHFSSATAFYCFLKDEHPNKKKEPVDKLLDGIFLSLKEVKGIGGKTAALFIKNLLYIHHHENEGFGYPEDRLGFWDDPGLQCSEGDKIYVPVDAVIIQIFEGTKIGAGFDSINKTLHKFMSDSEKPMIDMLYWDDLWYWGFFTQRGGGGGRRNEINCAKFMSWKNSSPESFKVQKPLAEEFFRICAQLREGDTKK